MKGYQLTFFCEQNRRHEHSSLGEWLLRFSKEHGAVGGTIMQGSQGFDHLGNIHSAHFFELADQPIAITMSINEAECEKLLEALNEAGVRVSYTKIPIEYGQTGVQQP